MPAPSVIAPTVSSIQASVAPFLYVGSRRDRTTPLREAMRIFRSVGSRDKRTAIYRGSGHGVDLVRSGPHAARARALILAWIRSRSA